MILKTKKQRLREWLQNYANEHKCYVCINSDYSPCVIAIKGNPIRRYDEEDGYWYWGCHGKGKSKWIDKEIRKPVPADLMAEVLKVIGNDRN